MSYNFLIIGGDKRISSLAKKLKEDGHTVNSYANNIEGINEIATLDEIEKINYDIIISSVPLSKDGINVNTPLSEKKISLAELKIIAKGKKLIAGNLREFEGYDILKDESYTILNTISTAEGAVQVAMEETSFELCKSKCLVLGFGRVGKTLCNRLQRMGTETYCMARKETDRAWIEAYGYSPISLEDLNDNICKMNIIFNTVPTKILDKDRLVLLGEDCLIVDLASAPGGVDFDSAKQLGIKAILALGLPGKVAPDSVASYMKKFVDKVVHPLL